jgi:hypothetical protein
VLLLLVISIVWFDCGFIGVGQSSELAYGIVGQGDGWGWRTQGWEICVCGEGKCVGVRNNNITFMLLHTTHKYLYKRLTFKMINTFEV